jgi:hypothetical protein
VYTNLTVRWFKAYNPPALTGTSATTEIISDNHIDYSFSRYNVTDSTKNCTDGPLYHDTFSLNILNFTMDKNGYYWYQIFINGSSYQPSQYAQFNADYELCILNLSYFKRADEIQCANATYIYLMTSPLVMTSTFPTKDLSTVTSKMTEMGINPIYYVIGALTVLMILFATLAITILLMVIRKRHKEHRKKSGESIACQSTLLDGYFFIN